jgi:hypothetical protein
MSVAPKARDDLSKSFQGFVSVLTSKKEGKHPGQQSLQASNS